MSEGDGRTQAVLRNWGDAKLVPGPMNPTVGHGLAEVLIRIVQQQAGVKNICDLGCGTGYLASRLGALGYSVTGVDASERLLAVAAEHYASERVSFHRAVIGDDSLEPVTPPGGFDLVVSSDVVEHLFDPVTLVREASSVLKPDGRLIIGTPYHGYLKNVAISVLGRWDAHHGVHWAGGHIKFFSVRTLRNLVSEAGCAVEQFHYYGRMPWLWKNMICVARKNPA